MFSRGLRDNLLHKHTHTHIIRVRRTGFYHTPFFKNLIHKTFFYLKKIVLFVPEYFPPNLIRVRLELSPAKSHTSIEFSPAIKINRRYSIDAYMMMILLLFLQKQNLAFAIYLFGLGTRLSGPGLKHMR